MVWAFAASPTDTPLEPPVISTPTASPLVRVTPWRLTALIFEPVTPLNTAAGDVAVPKIVVTSAGSVSVKFCL